MNLVIANYTHIVDIVTLLEDLHNSSAYSYVIPFSRTDTYLSVEKLLEAGQENNCIILLMDQNKAVGIIGMSHMTHMFNSKEKTAIELAFWLLEPYRTKGNARKLLQAYRFWAKRIGCTSILIGNLKGPKEVETYRIKRIN